MQVRLSVRGSGLREGFWWNVPRGDEYHILGEHIYNITLNPPLSSLFAKLYTLFQFSRSRQSIHCCLFAFFQSRSPPVSGESTASGTFLRLSRRSLLTNAMSASSFLQLQTRAAHPPKRPQNQPDKDIQVTTFSSSSTSPSSPGSSIELSPAQSPLTDWARCSRCHRSVSVDGSLPSMTGVSFGINSYYCQRCAKWVGYKT